MTGRCDSVVISFQMDKIMRGWRRPEIEKDFRLATRFGMGTSHPEQICMGAGSHKIPFVAVYLINKQPIR